MSIRSSRTWTLAGVAVLALAGTVWGLLNWTDDGESDLPAELTVESLKAQANEDPGRMMATLREASQREDLTEEQRRQAFGNMREVWQEQMTERVDEYFAAADGEKEALLDRHIDEFQERMKDWGQRRDEWEKERKEREAKRLEDGADTDEAKSDEEDAHDRTRSRWGSRTQQERKERSESRNPDQMARMMGYFSALRERASARGVTMWGGRGGYGSGGGRH